MALFSSLSMATAAACELHAWPGSGLGSVYHGWFHGGIVNGSMTGREGYPQVPPDPLGTAEQRRLLNDLHLPTLIGMAEHDLILHDDALPSRAIRTATGRLAESRAPCYAELIVDDVILQQDVVTGNHLKILFRFRDFGDGAAPVRIFSTWVKTQLTTFPPRQPDQQTAALQELQTAFASNLRLFAQALAKPLRRK